MAKQIVFNNGTEDVTLTVQGISEYVYNALKTVVRITINEEDHTYEEIKELSRCESDIKFYEENDLKSEYSGCVLGSLGFTTNYSNGLFTVELVKENSYGARLDALENTMYEVMMLVGDLIE